MIYPNFGMLLKLYIFKMILSFLHQRSYNGASRILDQLQAA